MTWPGATGAAGVADPGEDGPGHSRGEDVVRRINRRLEPLEADLTSGFQGPELPVAFILGPPRSGTTLMSQLLADWGGFAYVSNFLARFWRAPYLGSILEREIGIRESYDRSTYRSESGATFTPAEPHEFTWFWNRWFDRGQETQKLGPSELASVDGERLRREVAALEAAWSAPVVFKNSFWHNFQVDYLAELFPASVYVRCHRDPVYAAQSIVLSREALRGDRERWWSMKPAEYSALAGRHWSEQVVGQVYHTERELDRALGSLPPDRVVDAPYEEVCADPGGVVGRVVDAVNRGGASVPTRGELPDGFSPTDRRRLPETEFEEIRAACRRLYGGGG